MDEIDEIIEKIISLAEKEVFERGGNHDTMQQAISAITGRIVDGLKRKLIEKEGEKTL